VLNKQNSSELRLAAVLISYYILPEHFHAGVQLRTQLRADFQLPLRIPGKAEILLVSELMLKTGP